MIFGMNLLLWSGDLNEAMLPVLEMLKKAGYDGVEVPIFDADVQNYAQWGKRLDDLGLRRTAVTIRTAGRQPDQPRRQVARLPASRPQSGRSIAARPSAPKRCAAHITRPLANSPAQVPPPTSGSGASTACGKSPSMPAQAA